MAVSEIEKNRRRWEENPKGLAFAAYADALRKAGEADQALEVLQAGLEYHPDYIPANIVRGRCHLDLGEDAAAEAAFGRVLALDPENVIALKALADVTERGQRWSEATRWLNTLLGIDRGNDAAREQIARIEIARHEAELAAAQAQADGESAAHAAELEAAAHAEAERVAAEQRAAEDEAAARAVADAPLALERSQPDAWVPTATEEASPSVVVAEPLTGLEATSFTADEVPAAPLEGFVTEETAESAVLLSASAAGGEFAVEDAADGFRATMPEGHVASPDATVATPSWADVGKGEYVPALFADAEAAAVSEPATSISPLDGLVLERSSDEPLVSAATEPDIAAPELPTPESDPVMPAADQLDAPPDFPIGHVTDDAADATVPTWAAFHETDTDSDETAAAEPSADAVAHALIEADPVAAEGAVIDAAAGDPTPDAPVQGEVLAEAVGESLVLPQLEPGEDEAIEPAPVAAAAAVAAIEAVADPEAVAEIEPGAAAPTIEPIRVPGIVQALALAPHEVEAADRAARELIEAELAASHERPLRDVLAEAPAADPVVVALLAAPPVLEDVQQAEPEAVPVRLLPQEAEPVDVAPEASADAAPTAAPVATFVADEPDDESAAVPPGFSTPLLVTAAMATLYAQQGHLHEALATYKSLDAREPGRHAAAIADLEVRIAASLPARPVFAARVSGGQPVRDFFQSLVRTVPAALVDAVAPATGNGVALRKADDTVSLGRLFGEESATTAVPLGIAARTPSFDEFYGAAGTAKEQGGRDDIEQFHAWLQGLKS